MESDTRAAKRCEQIFGLSGSKYMLSCMRIEAALIREQGVNFAVVVVRRSVLDSSNQREDTIAQFSRVFDGVPIVLMAQDGRGTPRYFGRTDLVDWLSNVPFEALPWAEYSVN